MLKPQDCFSYKLGLDKETIWDNEIVGRFDMLFPKVDFEGKPIEGVPIYVVILLNGKKHYLKSKIKQSRRGNIYVSPQVYDGNNSIPEFSCDKASEISAIFYKLRNDHNQQIAFGGLILAIVGVIIDGAFAIGKTGLILFTLSVHTTAFFLGLTMVLKVIGLYLIYWKGLRESK
jgi:hypothetical protein